MAIVIHTIKGNKYFYNHFREGNKIKTVYLYPSFYFDSHKLIITDNVPNPHNLSLKEQKYLIAHSKASELELKAFGKENYNEFNEWIKNNLKGLAGSSDKKGNIYINSNVPEKFKQQLIYHEFRENKILGKGMKGNKIKEAMKHKDILGEGAKKRISLNLSQKKKIEVVMKEFERGNLYSGSGKKVKSREQAIAIALSESRKI